MDAAALANAALAWSLPSDAILAEALASEAAEAVKTLSLPAERKAAMAGGLVPATRSAENGKGEAASFFPGGATVGDSVDAGGFGSIVADEAGVFTADRTAGVAAALTALSAASTVAAGPGAATASLGVPIADGNSNSSSGGR